MRVKNIVFKTIFITFGVVLILAIAIFGIVSLAAPATMMTFTRSLGLRQVSGDYAFQEFERSGSIAYLADSFVVSAETKRDQTAEERFKLLYAYDKNGTTFEEFCKEQDKVITQESADGEETPYAEGTYRAYVCGLAACVRYRLADSEDAKKEVITFALSETDASFPVMCPATALAMEAVKAEDESFCKELLAALEAGGYDETADFSAVTGMLQSVQ